MWWVEKEKFRELWRGWGVWGSGDGIRNGFLEVIVELKDQLIVD